MAHHSVPQLQKSYLTLVMTCQSLGLFWLQTWALIRLLPFSFILHTDSHQLPSFLGGALESTGSLFALPAPWTDPPGVHLWAVVRTTGDLLGQHAVSVKATHTHARQSAADLRCMALLWLPSSRLVTAFHGHVISQLTQDLPSVPSSFPTPMSLAVLELLRHVGGGR